MQAKAEAGEQRLLLLGVTGNVGQHCLTRLLANAAESGESVKLLVGTRDPKAFSSTYSHPPSCPAVVEAVACDVGDAESIAAVIQKAMPTRVFIALPQALGPEAMLSCGQACVDACVAAGVGRLVRLSSLNIDKAGQGPLGNAHCTIEAHAKKCGLGVVSVRPTSFHTNLLAYDAESIRTANCFRSPLGSEARVNWVHCRDIGNVCAVALGEKPVPEVINVTGPSSSTLSTAEMASVLSEELGRTISYEEVKPPPIPEYEALWEFLKSGGFDASSTHVEELTGVAPTDFRTIINEARAVLCP